MNDVLFPLPNAPRAPFEPPPEAVVVFADRLPLAIRFADILCTRAVERGLLGPREAARVWDRHLLNSAVLASAVPTDALVADVGSGAGLPGIPLWLARPDLRVRLIEPMQRRVEFLREVVAELGLPIDVLHGRAEQQPRASVDVVVVRAVAPLGRLIPLALPLLRPGGRLLALKGRSAAAEIAKAGAALRQWPDARLHCESVGTGESATTMVRIDRMASQESGR